MHDYLNGVKMKTLFKHKAEVRGGVGVTHPHRCVALLAYPGCPEGQVTHLVYLPRDKSVLSASRDNTIVVSDEADPDTGTMLKEMRVRHSNRT